jgi:hypothetical protein
MVSKKIIVFSVLSLLSCAGVEAAVNMEQLTAEYSGADNETIQIAITGFNALNKNEQDSIDTIKKSIEKIFKDSKIKQDSLAEMCKGGKGSEPDFLEAEKVFLKKLKLLTSQVLQGSKRIQENNASITALEGFKKNDIQEEKAKKQATDK